MAKIERSTLSKMVIDEVKGRIMSGQWKPGMRLPTEKQLLEEFEISRSPLREALRALETIELISIRHGEGIFVVDELPPYLDTKKQFLTLDMGISALHLLDIRRILEVEAIKRAAHNVTEADLDNLKAILDNMFAFKDDLPKFREADLEFHLAVSEFTNNPLLTQIIKEMRELLKKQMELDTLVSESLEDHLRMYNALRDGKHLLAQQAMEVHFKRMYDYYLSEEEK